MKISEKWIAAILTILIGVLFIVMKSGVIGVAMTVLGAVLIVLGLLDLLQKEIPPAVVKIVIGALIILFGWTITNAVLYIVAALALIYGVLLLYQLVKCRKKGSCLLDTLLGYAVPVLFIVIGLLLFFNQGGTLNWVFIVAGIFTVIEGGLMLIDAINKD